MTMMWKDLWENRVNNVDEAVNGVDEAVSMVVSVVDAVVLEMDEEEPERLGDGC